MLIIFRQFFSFPLYFLRHKDDTNSMRLVGGVYMSAVAFELLVSSFKSIFRMVFMDTHSNLVIITVNILPSIMAAREFSLQMWTPESNSHLFLFTWFSKRYTHSYLHTCSPAFSFGQSLEFHACTHFNPFKNPQDVLWVTCCKSVLLGEFSLHWNHIIRSPSVRATPIENRLIVEKLN